MLCFERDCRRAEDKRREAGRGGGEVVGEESWAGCDAVGDRGADAVEVAGAGAWSLGLLTTGMGGDPERFRGLGGNVAGSVRARSRSFSRSSSSSSSSSLALIASNLASILYAEKVTIVRAVKS
jgi:hypothetical protein